MNLSVIIPTHNPHLGRLTRVLRALREQTLEVSRWETVIVDNSSNPPVGLTPLDADLPDNVRVVPEPVLGLTSARRRGFNAARGDVIVLVDDDNVLAPDYLARVLEIFSKHPQLGAVGGKSLPEFETPPEPWMREFDSLLACRDLGSEQRIASQLWDEAAGRNAFPAFAPIGAGMAFRRLAVVDWSNALDASLTDRRGGELTSGGDNDIVFTVLRAGWQIAYFPDLVLTHLIPSTRVQPAYLARLNRAIARSWIHVLAKHDANPWPPIAPWTVPLRCLKAWFTYRAWSGPAPFIRWQGACGHFEGRSSITS